jgi:quercetin dioxygenase-like cupin family protein
MTTLKFTRWTDVPEEQLNPLLSRRVISGERAMVAQITLKKGCVVPEHAHESEQISLVFMGALQFTIGGEQITVREGEVLCIPSGVPHAAIALEDCFEMDAFSPIRRDWLDGTDKYLRK